MEEDAVNRQKTKRVGMRAHLGEIRRCSLSILVAPNTHEVCTGYTAVTKGSKIYLSFMHISITVKEGGEMV